MAAVAALKEGHSSDDRMVTEFRGRRDVIVEGLRQIPGFQCARPGRRARSTCSPTSPARATRAGRSPMLHQTALEETAKDPLHDRPQGTVAGGEAARVDP